MRVGGKGLAVGFGSLEKLALRVVLARLGQTFWEGSRQGRGGHGCRSA